VLHPEQLHGLCEFSFELRALISDYFLQSSRGARHERVLDFVSRYSVAIGEAQMILKSVHALDRFPSEHDMARYLFAAGRIDLREHVEQSFEARALTSMGDIDHDVQNLATRVKVTEAFQRSELIMASQPAIFEQPGDDLEQYGDDLEQRGDDLEQQSYQ
jgi:hypothetical protein